MGDVYTEFLDALHEVQRTSGLGPIRPGRLLGVSRDMMKSPDRAGGAWVAEGFARQNLAE